VGTDETTYEATLETDETVFAAAGVSLVAPQEVDEEFLRTSARELAESADPIAALHHEEQVRTGKVTPIAVALALLAMALLPLFGGTPWAKNLLYTTLVICIVCMSWLWSMVYRDIPIRDWHWTVGWGVAFQATCATCIFFGVYSPAPIIMAMAIVIYAQGRDLLLARIIYAAAALTQASVSLLDAFGIADDPGLVQVDELTTIEKLSGQLLVQCLLATAYVVGRVQRKSSTAAIAKTQEAMQELARREVVAREAREEIRRALNIGGAGRYSGQVFGSFKLAEVIGQGGMGEVYRAEHETLGTQAAVKVIHPNLCHDEKVLQRFLREAQLSASLQSPHIVRVLDAGGVEKPYLAMELLHGCDLASHFQDWGLLSLELLQELAEQVSMGLDAAAEAGIVHRDIKPQNLFLVQDESSTELHCKILDFGVARAMSGQAALTVGDVVLGTPNYMAPEQALGESMDHRSDLYALVSVLYRACTGFAPFGGDSPHAVLYSVVHDMPQPPSQRAALPGALDAFFAKGFAKNPDDRYQSGQELSEALKRACQTDRRQAG
jgi:serine/threonine-protein kinase